MVLGHICPGGLCQKVWICQKELGLLGTLKRTMRVLRSHLMESSKAIILIKMKCLSVRGKQNGTDKVDYLLKPSKYQDILFYRFTIPKLLRN